MTTLYEELQQLAKLHQEDALRGASDEVPPCINRRQVLAFGRFCGNQHSHAVTGAPSLFWGFGRDDNNTGRHNTVPSPPRGHNTAPRFNLVST